VAASFVTGRWSDADLARRQEIVDDRHRLRVEMQREIL
jgi:hypothetical protein